jgi:hypothetical protein
MLKKNVISNYIFLYKMFEEKFKIVKKYFENNLKKEFIIANRFSFVSSIMFMKKTNKSLKFVRWLQKIKLINQKE